MREEGRGAAWADLERRLMENAHVLISAGWMSPKEWVSLSIEIEQFRKSEQGSAKPAGDWLSEWLREDTENASV